MEGGQSGTYLRLTRVSSGPRVSVTKTYRDETKWKWIFQPDHSGLPQQYNTRDWLSRWASLRHIEMKRNENEYFSQITVAFLSSIIQETEAKLFKCRRDEGGVWGVNGYALNVMLSTLEKPVAPFPTAWMGTGSPPRYQTQTCQLLSTHNPTRSLSRNADLLMSYTNCQTPRLTTFVASLKQHTNLSSNHITPLVSTTVNPPLFHTHPSSIYNICQSFLLYCWRRPQCFAESFSFPINSVWAWRCEPCCLGTVYTRILCAIE